MPVGDKERGRGLKQRFVLHCSLSPRTEKSLREHNEEEWQKNAELSRLRLEPPAAFLSPPLLPLSAPPSFPAVLKSTSNFGHRVIKFKQGRVPRKYKKETQSSKISNSHFPSPPLMSNSSRSLYTQSEISERTYSFNVHPSRFSRNRTKTILHEHSFI